jgi:YVTN family beta-propeller protein
MEFRVLGPLEVRDGERTLPLAGAKQRGLLALLLVHANHVLSRDRLIDELWGDEPPETATQSLQVYVSRLRKLLPPDTLLTRPPGYLLEVEPEELDLRLFERLLADGRRALAQGDPGRASGVLREALALWRGPALAEFRFERFAQAEIGRLEDLRLAAVEERVEADLALGRHADLIGELEALVEENPYRERLRGQLMRALYRSGRQAEALEAYRDARRALVDELGIEPSAELQRIEMAILKQDVELDSPVLAERPRGTVTFLFTDVEGSTQLLKQLSQSYGDELAEQQLLLREAFAAHSGEEIDSQGDSFFYVFSRARDAAAAAADGQRALASHDWPEGAEFRVRMGMHTGEPVLSDEGRYYGMGVHRAARIMAAGHGGQVLASQATASLLADDELDGVTLCDLGEHHLKDMDRPERIYQLEVEDLPSTFPPLRTDAESRAAETLAAVGSRPFYRRPLVIGALAGVVAAAIAIPVFALGGSSGGSLSALSANSVGVVDSATGAIVDQVLDVPTPARVAAGANAIWVTSSQANTVSRIDASSRQLRQTIQVGNGPNGIVFGAGDIWVANSLDGTVSRIDTRTNTVVGEPIPVGNSPTGMAFADGSVWVTNVGDETVSRIDGKSGKVLKTIDVGAAGRGIAAGGGAIWIGDSAQNRVVRVDPTTNAVTQTIGVGSGPSALAFGAGAVWVANTLDGTVSRIDPRSNQVRATVQVGASPSAIAASDGSVWVSNEAGRTIVQLDPRSGSVVRTVETGTRPTGLTLAGSLWVGGQAASGVHRGGTLSMQAQAAPDTIDPGKAYVTAGSPILAITNDGLVAFKRVGGGEGTQLVPDLATSLPVPTDGGKTYTFQLRRGIHFSNGKPVTPADVRWSIVRVFAIPGSPGAAYFRNIVGAAACTKRPLRCDLRRGIVIDTTHGTVAFHLTEADPELLYKLAVSPAAIVPMETPRHASTEPLPGTGPYMITKFDPKRQLRLVRNPHFNVWSAVAQPDGYPDTIVLTFKDDIQGEVTRVERGQTDVAYSSTESGIPPNRLGELTTQYAGQLHVTPQAAQFYLQLNTREGPFDDVRVRRALNYAIDRGAIIRFLGGPLTAQPTCQILPANFPGYRPSCPYTLDPTAGGAWTAPDLAKARALVRASGTRGMTVTVFTCPCFYGIAVTRLVRRALEDLGYRVTLKPFTDVFAYIGAIFDTSRRHVQIAISGWSADFPAASNFFGPLLTCANAKPSRSASNGSRFCDRAIDAEIKRALQLQLTDPPAANGLWQRIDREVVGQAPWVPLFTPRAIDLVSPRVGNFQRHPVYGMLLDQFWVK